MFGKDSTKGGIEFQFRTLRANGARQREAFENGIDPQTLNIAMAKWLNDGRTASALEHQFRPIKAAAKNASSTAEKFGDGTTGSTPKKTRAPRNPSKKTPKKTALSSNEEGDDDSDLEMNTPSKKSSPVKKESMNKVKGGRVEKKNGTPARAAKNTVKSYIDSDDEEYDDELIIKDEDTNAYDFGRAADGDEDMLGGGGGGFLGHGHGNGRGNGSGGFVEEENDFFDSES